MTVASPRPRPARQGLTDFTLPVAARRHRRDRAAARRAGLARSPTAQAGFDAFEALPAEIEPAVHDLLRPARRVQLANARLTPVAADRAGRRRPAGRAPTACSSSRRAT